MSTASLNATSRAETGKGAARAMRRAGKVAERPRQRIVRHDAQPDLVGNQHHRPRQARQARDQPVAGGLDLASGE